MRTNSQFISKVIRYHPNAVALSHANNILCKNTDGNEITRSNKFANTLNLIVIVIELA